MADDNRIASETAWNSGANGSATGGGVSDVFARPDWQANAGIPARKDGSLGSGVPDVAAAADPETGYTVFVDGNWEVVGGTAAATPLWAGLVALLSQGVGHNLGHLNPRLYSEVGPAQILVALKRETTAPLRSRVFLRDPAGTLWLVGAHPIGKNCWIGCAPIQRTVIQGHRVTRGGRFMGYFSRNLNPQQDLDLVEFDTAGIAHPRNLSHPGTVTSTLRRAVLSILRLQRVVEPV